MLGYCSNDSVRDRKGGAEKRTETPDFQGPVGAVQPARVTYFQVGKELLSYTLLKRRNSYPNKKICISQMEIPTYKLKGFYYQSQEDTKSCVSIESAANGKSEDKSLQGGRMMLQIKQVRF